MKEYDIPITELCMQPVKYADGQDRPCYKRKNHEGGHSHRFMCMNPFCECDNISSQQEDKTDQDDWQNIEQY